VAGTTTSTATNVTVNTSNAVLYADATFAKDHFTIANGNNTFTAIAKDSYGRKDTNSITVNLLATNVFAYDLNGNMLTNGNEVMVWNDENQLVTNFVAGSWKSEFVYDGKFRRRIQRDYSWNGSSWTQTNEIHLVYDGNVIIQYRDANNLPTLTFTRGNDLSGSLQGAGGIGGLLALTESSGIQNYYHADGNGNVTCLINTNQLIVAKAEYDPYGNFLSLSGPKAGVNPFWFSSKPIHWLSGKYDFLYRWYVPSLQRWPNRDPLGELGFETIRNVLPMRLRHFMVSGEFFEGANLYEFVENRPSVKIDAYGLFDIPGGGLSIPPNFPDKDLNNAITRYFNACGPKGCQDPQEVDCNTICGAFFGNISGLYVAACQEGCADCKLTNYFKKHPPKKGPKKT
jgi:RHS repeat-associated protein